jgi:hypothetical protein
MATCKIENKEPEQVNNFKSKKRTRKTSRVSKNEKLGEETRFMVKVNVPNGINGVSVL